MERIINEECRGVFSNETNTIAQLRAQNFCEIQKMIYSDLPMLLSKITFATFLNSEYGSTIINPESIKCMMPFMDEIRKVFDINLESCIRELENMVRLHRNPKDSIV